MAFSAEADVWELKTRARYEESELARRLLEKANDPHATASELATVAQKVLHNYSKAIRNYGNEMVAFGYYFVMESLAAHPNTPPSLFGKLINQWSPICRAFCQNPVTPFLLLESPNFTGSLDEKSQNALLREAETPLSLVQMLAMDGGAARNKAIQRAARLHVAFAGEVASREEWERLVRDDYRIQCVETTDTKHREFHADLVEIGLVPEWADGGRPFRKPKSPVRTSSCLPVKQWLRFDHAPGSDKEAELLNAIAPEVKDTQSLAWGLRADATQAELQSVLRNPAGKSEKVKELILRHPSITIPLIKKLLNSEFDKRIIVTLPHATQEILRDLLKRGDVSVRRAARQHPNAPPDAEEISRRVFIDVAQRRRTSFATPLISLVASLYNGEKSRGSMQHLETKATHLSWTERFEAALICPVSDTILPGDFYGRTGRDLLEHLTHDGNRIVRGAAKARLADPNYRFSLWDGAENDAPA